MSKTVRISLDTVCVVVDFVLVAFFVQHGAIGLSVFGFCVAVISGFDILKVTE